MLSHNQRTAILELHAQGISKREISRVLKVSRLTVRKVLRSQSSAVPLLHRPEKAAAFRQQILELLAKCKGNLVRVHEELAAQHGAQMSYPALTAFCRRHGIGQTPKEPSGHYAFEPASETQHDTSPHEAEIAGKMRSIQSASAVLCYSRMIFFQGYPRFQRFDCKVFLTEALRYFGGATTTMMIDNTHVVVLRGTGPSMVPVPEMEAFAQRFGFRFAAHKVGDANRSAGSKDRLTSSNATSWPAVASPVGKTSTYKPASGAIASTAPIRNIFGPCRGNCLPSNGCT